MKTQLLQNTLNHGAHGVTRPTKHIARPAWALLFLCLLWLATTFMAQAAPCVTNVTVLSATNGFVTFTYYISDASYTSANVYALVSADSGTNWTVPATNFGGYYGGYMGTHVIGTGVAVTADPHTQAWNAGTDWPNHYTTNCRVRVVACDNGMVMIPAGYYNRGDAVDGSYDAPVYSIFINPFLMDSNLVSYSQWQTVYNWATNHGYSFDNAGSGKAANHPVQTVNWYDCVKWCNARSEMEGVPPVYYNPTNMTAYRTGDFDGIIMATNANGTVTNGYRLPTEAEWEKAARGGLSGQRFPWGNTITNVLANYHGDTTDYSYDLGPNGFNPNFNTSGYPYTSPIGTFPANGYGLFDMAGNVYEWCWDWYGNYPQLLQSNTQGASLGTARVFRGGSWDDYANSARCANRGAWPPTQCGSSWGFRCVRGF